MFGHIHEGWGGERVVWDDTETGGVDKREPIEINQEGGTFLDLTTEGGRPLRFGEETVCLNAAVVDLRYRPVHAPWVVDLELMRR